MECVLKKYCKRKETCSLPCYPNTVMHGLRGDSGYWGTKNTPKKYSNLFIKDLPIKEENPETFEIIKKYIEDILLYVREKNLGLYLFSIPNPENRLGTGTGKSTTACILLNEYLVVRVLQGLKDKDLAANLAYFVRLSEFQNKYNEQFRGSSENRETAANRFYSVKKRMMETELLAIDDVAVRDGTEAFKNELYDIIDYRAIEGLTTIFTSNYPIPEIREFLGDRICSRIEGMTVPLGFKGIDHRRRVF